MEYTTIRAGHYEVNYGDAHYRRSDGGYTVRNPFVENYILDAFTTEIGAEAMVRKGPAFVIAGVTSGQNKGDVKESAVKARPAFVGKIGFDQSLSLRDDSFGEAPDNEKLEFLGDARCGCA